MMHRRRTGWIHFYVEFQLSFPRQTGSPMLYMLMQMSWNCCLFKGRVLPKRIPEYDPWDRNKLASIEAALAQNSAQRPSESVTGVTCRATSAAKSYGEVTYDKF